MTILTRITRLFKADLHALLDQMEAPDVLLKQAVREMEAEQLQLNQALEHLGRQRERIQKQLDKLHQLAGEHEEGLALCLQQGNDDLARALLRKSLEASQLSKQLQGRLHGCQTELAESRRRFDQQQLELEQVRQQVELSDGGSHQELADWLVESLVDSPVGFDRITDTDVELALMKAKSARQTSPGLAVGGNAS